MFKISKAMANKKNTKKTGKKFTEKFEFPSEPLKRWIEIFGH